jgi:hypothetical protein
VRPVRQQQMLQLVYVSSCDVGLLVSLVTWISSCHMSNMSVPLGQVQYWKRSKQPS